MTDNLIEVLSKNDCTLEEIKFLLENQPNMQTEINREIEGSTPLIKAIETRKSVDIVIELIKKGADVNMKVSQGSSHYPIVIACSRAIESRCDKISLDLVEKLLDYGANVNVTQRSAPLISVFFFPYYRFSMEVFIPCIRLMFQYADNNSKNFTLYAICFITIRYTCKYSHEDEWVLENCIKTLKWLMEYGVYPDLTFFRFVFLFASEEGSDWIAKMNVMFVMDLFKIIVPYVFVKNVCKYNELITYNITDDFESVIAAIQFRKWSNKIHIAKILFSLCKRLWNKCLEECQKMQYDLLINNRSVMQTLQDLFETDFKTQNVTSDVLHEMLIKIAQNKYPHFSDVMKYAVKNCDMNKLYMILSIPYSGNVTILHYDLFFYTTQYLTKDDVLNYLLALLPKKI